MKDWIKKNRDTILIVGVSTIATATVAAVSYRIASNAALGHSLAQNRIMSLIASDAGALDTIIAHQDKLKSIIPA